MSKGTSQAETTSDSKKNLASAIVKLRLSEGISPLARQAVSQSVENSVK